MPFKKVAVQIFLFMMLFCGINTVYADGVYYTNDYGVSFSENEYNYVEEMYGEGYVDNVHPELYELISGLNLDENEVTIESYNEVPEYVPFASSYETNSKRIAISVGCNSSFCRVTTVATWFTNPNVRSHDVIGSRFINTSFDSDPAYITIMNSSAGAVTCDNYKIFTNGLGNTCKLPTSVTGISITMSYDILPAGTIYASYQHAKSSISLTNSKKYLLSISGYGNVLLFDSSIRDKYDQMGGVNITV